MAHYFTEDSFMVLFDVFSLSLGFLFVHLQTIKNPKTIFSMKKLILTTAVAFSFAPSMVAENLKATIHADQGKQKIYK